jgi:hypothetical protein
MKLLITLLLASQIYASTPKTNPQITKEEVLEWLFGEMERKFGKPQPQKETKPKPRWWQRSRL